MDLDLQKIGWKFFFKKNVPVPSTKDSFTIFNTWIANSPEVFIDVSDYSHVPEGPVTLLSGYYADVVIDRTDDQLGFLYQQKIPLSGTTPEKLEKTLKLALAAATRFENEPILKGTAAIDRTRLHFLINDRAIAPNQAGTFSRYQNDLASCLTRVFGQNPKLTHLSEPRKRFRVLSEWNR
jgi:hypothetical protein